MITPAFNLTATERVLPRLALDFTTASLDPRVTLTRALNTATRVNSSGYIEAVNADAPRFDYDPVTLVCKGLLIEEQRTNSLLRSEQMGTSPWSVLNATVNATGGISPANTNTANVITDNATTGAHGVFVLNGWPSGVQSTLSVYVKADTLSKVAIGNASTGAYSYFDLQSGTNVANATGFTGTIIPAGNGWYRITATHTASASQTLGIFSYVNVGNPSYSGTGQSFYAWGAQLEAGAFATSYIPTVASTVTRNADVVSMTGTNFSDWYNASQGAFVAWFDTLLPTSQRYIYSASAGTSLANSFFQTVLSNTTDNYVFSGGVQQARLLTGAITANTLAKTGLRYANADFAVAANGGGLQTQLSGSLPAGVNRLHIGRSAGSGNFLNGHIAKLLWYTSLTNAELVAFTK